MLSCDKPTKGLFEEPEGEGDIDKINYYTNLVTGDVFKRYGPSTDQEKGDARFRNVYKVEKICSELTRQEEIDNLILVLEAKRRELKCIFKYDASKAVYRSECYNSTPIKSRCVITWKMIDGKLDVRARLVIKGFLDPQLNYIVTAPATASALSHRMLASYAVNHWYKIVSYDISQAFLQGVMLKDIKSRGENKRKVYLDPPADAWSILYEVLPEQFQVLHEVNSDKEVTLEAIKGVYGLSDAPRLWRQRFLEWIFKQYFKQSKFDECCYYKKIFKGAHKCKLVATMHVDDCEVVGNDSDTNSFKKALEREFGAVKTQ